MTLVKFMNSHRQAKNYQLTQLAASVQKGVIVELGAFRGEGTLALCRGSSGQLVYAVDDYRPRNGWAGEQYNKQDRRIFFSTVRDAMPVLLHGDVIDIGVQWRRGAIGLLVWDLGMEGRLSGDFEVWQRHVIGKFVIHDTVDQLLGSRELNPDGWRKYREGVFWILERLST